MDKRALITGITGQDGSYLAELLVSKGYEVHGIIRRSSSLSTWRIDHMYRDIHESDRPLKLHYGDMTDAANIGRLLAQILPSEIYNLAAQSHVQVSFQVPDYTCQVDACGTMRILEAIRGLGIDCRFYQASTSELFGKAAEVPQSEKTPFHPRSPYAVAKLYAHWITVNYREAYGLHASNGILFNHESPRRGVTFVTRKITRGVSRMANGLEAKIYLGNLDAKRDWGYAPEYVDAMWRMLQQPNPGDYVVATGECHSVREFAVAAFSHIDIDIRWQGTGIEEKGINAATGDILVEIDPGYYRPAEVDFLLGDPRGAERDLQWKASTSFQDLVGIMVDHDMRLARRETKVRRLTSSRVRIEDSNF